jgi:hypothetical protein
MAPQRHNLGNVAATPTNNRIFRNRHAIVLNTWTSKINGELSTSRSSEMTEQKPVNLSAIGTASRHKDCSTRARRPTIISIACRVAMMATHLRWEAFPLVLAFMLGGQLAHADIYTWVDASGATNVSNLSPPEGVRVTRVTHEDSPKPPVRSDTTRDATRDAEVQALSERVQQLQREVELARTYAPPPPPMPYPALPPAPAPAYAVDDMPTPANPCDSVFGGCGYRWGQPFYPASVFVVRAPTFRRAHSFHGAHHVTMQRPVQRPMRPSGGMHRR